MKNISQEFLGSELECDYIVSNMGSIGYALRNERGNIIRYNERIVVSLRDMRDGMFRARCLVSNNNMYFDNWQDANNQCLLFLLEILGFKLTITNYVNQ